MPDTTRIELTGFSDYLDHQMDNDFQQDTGLVVIPVASRESGHRVIRLHGGYGTRTVNWATTRMGKPPIAPAAEDGDEDTLLGSVLHSRLPKPNRAGGYDWTMSGSYTYVQDYVRVPGAASFPVGDYPFVVLPTMAQAAVIGQSSKQAYEGDRPFQSFISAIWAEQVPTGNFTEVAWPILAYPQPLFSHNHMI